MTTDHDPPDRIPLAAEHVGGLGRTPRQLTDDTVAAGDTVVTASGADV
ncbi:hypothetical protein ACFWP5_36295 [Streptomyces sp. NPDC058469]